LSTPDGIAVIGFDADKATLLQHYFDLRGVARVYEMTLAGKVWTLQRFAPAPDFSQRFTATFGDDDNTIMGRWEISSDGSNSNPDFDLTYTGVSYMDGRVVGPRGEGDLPQPDTAGGQLRWLLLRPGDPAPTTQVGERDQCAHGVLSRVQVEIAAIGSPDRWRAASRRRSSASLRYPGLDPPRRPGPSSKPVVGLSSCRRALAGGHN
jgi:hypothetical protein